MHAIRIQANGTAPYLSDRINALLMEPGLLCFKIAVAYARWDGVGLIASNIEGFLKKGGEFQSIYGVGNGITTPDSLLYALYLQDLYKTHSYTGAVKDKFANSIFHPKMYVFTFATKIVAFVGSANLTGAGLSRNTEIVMEAETLRGDPLEAEIEVAWNMVRGISTPVTLDLIRELKNSNDLGSEREDTERPKNKAHKPKLDTGVKTAPRPLFTKILAAVPAVRTRLLGKLDPLTERPGKLYLQILEGETGGRDGNVRGYQIQLPVATLTAFFGVGPTQSKQVTFNFPSERIVVQLTHFDNNTHRVRLRPIRDVERPAIITFTRLGESEYNCDVVPTKDYRTTLRIKCTEQTRARARKWGLE